MRLLHALLACRIAHAFGTPVKSPHAELCRTFPPANQVAELDMEDLAQLGVLPSRARTILALASGVADGDIHLEPGVNVQETMKRLQSIQGIGEWTAQYIAMRALAWPDAFAHAGLGVMKALNERNPKSVLAAGEAWRPWRAYAVMHLWTAGSADESVR